MAERGLTQQQIMSVLTMSPHLVVKKHVDQLKKHNLALKKQKLPPVTLPSQQARSFMQLAEYLPICGPAARQDPEFYAHLCSWNSLKGEVRDARVGLPVIALTAPNLSPQFADNALAHLASLDPRNLVRGLEWAVNQKVSMRLVKKLAARYLREREADVKSLERSMLQHRESMQRLYARYWVEPSHYAKAVLFGPGKRDNPDDPRWRVPSGSVFDLVSRLGEMPASEAASVIIRYKIPTLVIEGALKEKLKEPDIVLALIKAMSPTELVNKTKMLQRFGMRKDPILRAAYEEAIGKASTSKTRKVTLKATKAAEILAEEDDPANKVLEIKLRALQERQIEQKLSVEGDWLVLADKSGSMHVAIEVARQVAPIIARACRGQVSLILFNTMPQYFDATGKTYEELKKITANVAVGGGTKIDCTLDYAMQRDLRADGIVLISDGGENSGSNFAAMYERYAKKFDRRPTVYFWRLPGDPDYLSAPCQRAGVPLEVLDLGMSVDFNSLPNLVSMLKINRYSLYDEIAETPLLTLDEVLPRTARQTVTA